MNREFSSFRDPAGFVYEKDGVVLRQINESYRGNYECLMESGLYSLLTAKEWLIQHQEISNSSGCYKTILPERINFISYPYEWSFQQYKDAALLTLKIQKMSLENGMSLKDASAYNIQFRKGKPIFIDTLSFEKVEPNKPWKAYKQFCQHFLAPLALMSCCDLGLSCLMKNYIDGIPLELASKILPKFKSLGILIHIHLNALFQKKYNHSEKNVGKISNMSLKKHIALTEDLFHVVSSLKNPYPQTEWADYYSFTNYDGALDDKRKIVDTLLSQIPSPKSVWDLGANNGFFSRVASDKGLQTIAFDIDPMAVEKNYIAIKKNNEQNIIPFICDLLNPSPAIGWNNQERKSLLERGRPDVVFALALIHHLCISNNIPLDYLASFFAKLTPYLIIEFVPKDDSQVQVLLASREDIFLNYTMECFEKVFSELFEIMEKKNIPNTKRTLYLMKNKGKSFKS